MILKETQKLKIVTRALIFQERHLLVTKWKDGYCFPIGGKVNHGESLELAVKREVFEETNTRVSIKRLLYFCENIFTKEGAVVHEYGWYFWVEPDGQICTLDEELKNPDNEDLTIRYVKIDDLGRYDLYPKFLVTYLPADYENGFRENPKHILSVDRNGKPEIREVNLAI